MVHRIVCSFGLEDTEDVVPEGMVRLFIALPTLYLHLLLLVSGHISHLLTNIYLTVFNYKPKLLQSEWD
jgi:hypothetical protein